MVADLTAYGSDPLLERTTLAKDTKPINKACNSKGMQCLTYKPCTQLSSEHLLVCTAFHSSTDLGRKSIVSIASFFFMLRHFCTLQLRVLSPDETTLLASESGEASDLHERSRITPRNSV